MGLEGTVKEMGFEGTIQEMAEQLIEDFETERCTIRVLRGKKLRLIVARGINAETRREEIGIVGTIAGDALTTGIIQDVPDITNDKRYDPSYVVHNGAKSMIAIPLIFKNSCLGVAQIYRKDPFSNKDRNFAKTVAGYMAFTLWHIEISKMNRQAILDIFVAILLCKTFPEAFMQVVKEISNHLDTPRCLIYRIQQNEKTPWCQIVAGVPENEHEIGLSDPLAKHPDIQAIVGGKQVIEINAPLLDERTSHFKSIIEKQQINSILYVPIVVSNGEVLGVIVLDAAKDREGFSAEEKSFCFDVSRIVGCLFDREKKKAEDLEDGILNPSVALAAWATRYLDSVIKIYETAIDVCQNKKDCEGATTMFKYALEVMRNESRIMNDGKKLGAFVTKARNTELG